MPGHELAKEYIYEILEKIAIDYPILKAFLRKGVVVNIVERTDRKKGGDRTVYVLEFEEVPLSLSLKGSWMKNDIEGQVKGYLIAKLGSLPTIDVKIQAKNLFELSQIDSRTAITLEEALTAGIVTTNSPFIPFMKKYDVPYLQIWNDRILGPNIAAMEAIEKIFEHINITSIYDLTIGTGSLTKVALENGVKEAVGYDLDISIAQKTLYKYADRVKLFETDIFKENFSGQDAPFAIADPTMTICFRFVEEVIPRIRKSFKLFVFVHGHTEHTLWNKGIRKILQNQYQHIKPYSSLAMEMTFCTNDIKTFNKLCCIE